MAQHLFLWNMEQTKENYRKLYIASYFSCLKLKIAVQPSIDEQSKLILRLNFGPLFQSRFFMPLLIFALILCRPSAPSREERNRKRYKKYFPPLWFQFGYYYIGGFPNSGNSISNLQISYSSICGKNLRNFCPEFGGLQRRNQF